jgi:uncharacterized protein YdhG (YjbR/CyaY superfamily)
MKMKVEYASVEDYLKEFPPAIRKALLELRKAIRKAAPEAEERMSYGMAGYFQNGALLYFNGYKTHIGVYPRLKAFAKELSAYDGAKGSVKFSLEEPLPLTLISRMVQHQVIANKEKATAKTSKKRNSK